MKLIHDISKDLGTFYPCVLFAVVVVYLPMLCFVIPRKKRAGFAVSLVLLLTVIGPVLAVSVRVTNMLILAVLYGPVPAWNGDIYLTQGKPFIRLSDGTEFHNGFVWALVGLSITAFLGYWWLRGVLRILIAVTSPWPSLRNGFLQFYTTVRHFKKPPQSSDGPSANSPVT